MVYTVSFDVVQQPQSKAEMSTGNDFKMYQNSV